MPSRSQMDTPAMVVVLAIGAVLIVASVPFLDDVGSTAGGTTYLVSWDEVEADSASQATGAQNSEQTLTLAVEDINPANAVIELTACNDGFTAPVQQPATINWELQWETHTETGTASCAQEGPFTIEIEAGEAGENGSASAPDVGSVEAGSQGAAVTAAYAAAGDNESITFTLTYSWSRPGAPGGLPLPQPAFAATVSLSVSKWVATANEPEPEVPR